MCKSFTILFQNINEKLGVIDEIFKYKVNSTNLLEPDVLFLSEVKYFKKWGKKIPNIPDNYKIIFPKPHENNSIEQFDNLRISVLAIKKNSDLFYVPKKDARKEISRVARYLEGELQIGDISIKTFFAHVPQAYNLSKPIEYQLERMQYKTEMLCGMYYFVLENKDKLAIIGGDLNTDLTDKNAKCREKFELIVNGMEDTINDEQKNKPTWQSKRLDYSLVSKELGERFTCSTEYISLSGTDHKGLLTTISPKHINCNP